MSKKPTNNSSKGNNGNKVVLIVTEGLETEPNYFIDIRKAGDLKAGFTIKVNRCGKSPEKVVAEAVKLKKMKDPYTGKPMHDIVWAVFDHDTHEKLDDAFALAEKEGINVAFSAICFEVWILSHYVYTARAFQNADEVIAEIRKHMPEYNKSYKSLYDQTKANLSTAVTNAEKLRKSRENPTLRIQNPYLDIDCLIKQIVNDNIIRPPNSKK